MEPVLIRRNLFQCRSWPPVVFQTSPVSVTQVLERCSFDFAEVCVVAFPPLDDCRSQPYPGQVSLVSMPIVRIPELTTNEERSVDEDSTDVEVVLILPR